MSTEQADALTSYLQPEIAESISQQNTLKLQIRYKQIGLSYIQSCKDLASDNSGNIDIALLKQYILDAVSLLQNYHDAL